ncbi:MAG: 30S ribosomal protein S9, partial [Candidatus Aenigmarchaeota archaeon]|nr:30S ribosomal protein S9 [Candidatus Aenigmarchaeota archaeon]
MAKKEQSIQTTGTRKKATAIANIRKGKGIIRINTKPLSILEPRYVRMRI